MRSGSDIPAPVYWGFLVFVFSIPIEGLKVGPFTVSKVFGLLFFAVYLVYYNPCFSHLPGRKSFPQWPAPLWGFGIYLLIWVLSGLALPDRFLSRLPGLLFTLIQLMLIFWVASGLLRNLELARHSVIAFAGSTVFLACAMLAELPGFYEVIPLRAGPRVTALGYDPNTLGLFLALGVIALIGLRLNSLCKHWASRSLLLLSVVPLLMGIIKTGSRTAVAICAAGVLVNLAPSSKLKQKGIAWLLVGVVAIGMGYLILTDATMVTRIDDTVEQGSTAGRTAIASTALSMIGERPLLGWQPIAMWHTLAQRLSMRGERDAHNLYLHLFLEVGAMGALPFLFGLGWCGWNAWRRRNDHLGLIPFSLWLGMAVGNMAGTDYLMKSFWYVLALSVATGPILSRRQARQPSDTVTQDGRAHRNPSGSITVKSAAYERGRIPFPLVRRGTRQPE